MTKLEKPLSRLVDVQGQPVIVTLAPEDAGIRAHIKFRIQGQHKAYFSFYIELPREARP